MSSFPALHPHIQTLWAPSAIFEAGNPRQRQPLQLYGTRESADSSKQEVRRRRQEHAEYSARRDLVNVLRGTTTRMVWDYQAEAATLSDEEQEYEAHLESIRTHGFSWMVPEGKQFNQEAEADDEAINEEARVAAAAAAAQAQRDANAAEAETNDATRSSRRRQSRRRNRTRPRTSGTGAETRNSRSGPRSSGASGSGRPPNSRDRMSAAPPRASTGRYSISSSNGGNIASVPLPRYGVPSTSSVMSRTGRSSGELSGAGAQADERDLDAEIPDADEDQYGNDEDEDPADAVQHLDEDDDLFTDAEQDESDTSNHGRGRRLQNAAYEQASPIASDADEIENRENEDSTDMEVSS